MSFRDTRLRVDLESRSRKARAYYAVLAGAR